MPRGSRRELLDSLTDMVASIAVSHPVRIAIDGPPASGKTILADELAAALRAENRVVVRATIDAFLFPRKQRYRRGEYSPEGCYFDTHDWDGLNRVLLDPLGPGGDRNFHDALYDRTSDVVLPSPVATAPDDAAVIVDGVFLQRSEVGARWELRVFVSTAPGTTVERAVLRERHASTRAGIERRWRERYLPAQELYFAAVRPTDLADVIVHNDDPQSVLWRINTPR